MSNDVTRDGRNDSKSERSDGEDENHCEEKTVVIGRERRASWMISERSCKGSGKGEGRRMGERREVGEMKEKKREMEAYKEMEVNGKWKLNGD